MSAETIAHAAEDMRRVLDVVDAMHDDSPEFAATIIDEIGIDRTALAALRLLDVVIHLMMATDAAPDVAAEDITRYLRDSIGGHHV